VLITFQESDTYLRTLQESEDGIKRGMLKFIAYLAESEALRNNYNMRNKKLFKLSKLLFNTKLPEVVYLIRNAINEVHSQ